MSRRWPEVRQGAFSDGSLTNTLLARSNRETVRSADIELDDALRALCNDAFTHHLHGRFAEAISVYELILSLSPDLPEIYNNLGHALGALGRPEAAIVAFQRAVELKPDNPEALCNWGLALTELEMFDDAKSKYLRAISINPACAGAYNNLGLLLKEWGLLSEARQAFEQAIQLAPGRISYYDNLAAVRRFVADDPYLATLEVLAEQAATLSTADRIALHFALAKAHENLNRSESAFRHLLEGNRLKRKQIVYDEGATLGMMDRLCEKISRDFIRAHQGCGESSAAPVFIVGMTRSGTTLIEQILASHPRIFGAGELHLFDQAAGSLRNVLPGGPPFPEMMLKMSPAHLRTLGALYLARIRQRAPEATRITDKMTVNFLFIGLIHLALPNATIIHAVRDPADTCVSCFSNHFTKSQEHTYDLAELGRYHRHYRELMAHWHDVLPPGRILDVHYEELVVDLEGQSRRMVSHCGLPWDARCLDFHRTERPIRTASAVQVRKPIYSELLGRAGKYEAFLGPLFAELQPSPLPQT